MTGNAYGPGPGSGSPWEEPTAPIGTEPTEQFGTEPTGPIGTEPTAPIGIEQTAPIAQNPQPQRFPTHQPTPAVQPTPRPAPYVPPNAVGPSHVAPPYQDPYGGPGPYGTQPGYGGPDYGYQRATYGQVQPYGGGQYPIYGGYGYDNGYHAMLPLHPQSGTVFALGIAGIFVPFLAPVAWIMGRRARKDIVEGAPYRSDSNLNTGYGLGLVFTLLNVLGWGLFIMMMLLITVV